MKSTKNCCNSSRNAKNKTTKSSGRTETSTERKHQKTSSSESENDPDGSYTGNPVGWGKGAMPVQDVDDL